MGVLISAGRGRHEASRDPTQGTQLVGLKVKGAGERRGHAGRDLQSGFGTRPVPKS